MTEYCSVQLTESWESNANPNTVIEYVFESGNNGILYESATPRVRDHLHPQSGLTQRLQVTQLGHDASVESPNCQITLQCKALYAVSIAGVCVASEARMVELYDARDGSYLQTVRGIKDTDDSEADDSRVHFLCRCPLERPLGGISIKFLSLGQRRSFEIAHIQVVLESCSSQGGGGGAASRQTIDMDRLRQDVEDMGDTVSDRAKAFLTTLENFQKNKSGGVDDLRHLLLDKSAASGMSSSMAGITTLLSMFASSSGGGSNPLPSTQAPPSSFPAEGSVMSNMLTQMMASLAVKTEGGGGGGEGAEEVPGGERVPGNKDDMYRFLQSVCGQVSRQRGAQEGEEEEASRLAPGPDAHRAADKGSEEAGGLESRVAAEVEAAMESRLSEVEQHIQQRVDRRMQELEDRMTGKLDAIFALLQQQKPS